MLFLVLSDPPVHLTTMRGSPDHWVLQTNYRYLIGKLLEKFYFCLFDANTASRVTRRVSVSLLAGKGASCLHSSQLKQIKSMRRFEITAAAANWPTRPLWLHLPVHSATLFFPLSRTEGLKEYFSKYGEITEVIVMKDPTTKRSR